MHDLLVRGGTVVTASDAFVADVAVRDGRIVAIGAGLGPARRTIEASGRLVLPGGVDTHCHVEQRSSTGLMTADDFYTATVSAACGGTTTIVPFAAQHRGQSLAAVVADYRRRAAERAVVDYAFHLIVSDPTPQVLDEELPALVAEGHASLKIYMTYEALKLGDRQILDVLAAARRAGALVMVHAEHSDIVAWRTERLLAEGRTAPRFHAEARPAVAEAEATHRAIALAAVAGAALFVVHVTCREAIETIARARERGGEVYAETCPQYLLLAAADLDRPGFEGAKFLCSPPLRGRDDQEALWRALRDGTLDVVASDHAPYRFDDPAGKRAHGAEAPFSKVPSGVPGLEVRLPLLFSEGVRAGRLDIHRFVALTSTTPARLFGLYPQKGTIAPGSDADLAIWDPDIEVRIESERLHDAMDYTPYEGTAVRGWPVVTLSRGEIVCERGEVRAERGRGRLVPRRRWAGPSSRSGEILGPGR
jgi:dihydropyrimidinase